jgi:uncharacterized protein
MLLTTDQPLRAVLETAQTIAVVGHSDKPTRTSYQIAAYLRRAGYRVIPVNPTVPTIDNEISYPSLTAIPADIQIDIVNVFRRAEYLPDIVREAAQRDPKPAVVWGQLSVVHDAAVENAAEAELGLVMDRCIKIERERLLTTSR